MTTAGGDHRIRPAGPDDLDMVVACQTHCWDEAYRGVVPDSYLDDPSILARRRERWIVRLAGERHVLVATRPATPGLAEGVVSSGPSRDPAEAGIPELELMTLYVRARSQGSGLADGLLTACIDEASAFLWVFDRNVRAQAFYRRHGFRADGYIRPDSDTGLPELRMLR